MKTRTKRIVGALMLMVLLSGAVFIAGHTRYGWDWRMAFTVMGIVAAVLTWIWIAVGLLTDD